MAGNALEIYKSFDNPMQYCGDEKQLKAIAIYVGCSMDMAPAVAITCMCEGITLLDYIRNYYSVNGRPTKQTQAAVADFISNHNGVQTIVKFGPEKSVLRFKDKFGQETDWSLTLAECEASGWPWEKDGKTYKSNWDSPVKRADMIYYRNASRALRKICPAIFGGLPTAEEAADMEAEVVSIVPTKEKPSIDALLTEAAKQPKRETIVTSVAPVVNSEHVTATIEPVIDGEFESAEISSASGEVAGSVATHGQTARIAELLRKIYKPEELPAATDTVLAKRNVTAISLLSVEQAKELVDKLEAVVAQNP